MCYGRRVSDRMFPWYSSVRAHAFEARPGKVQAITLALHLFGQNDESQMGFGYQKSPEGYRDG